MMEAQRAELVFVVRQGDGGWLIDGPSTMGPFFSKDHALDLAHGMAQAIRSSGQDARVETR